MFEMLTGRAPFPHTDPPALITAHLHVPPPRVTDLRADLSPAWDTLIERGMAKNPDERYSTPREFADDARRILQGQAPAPVTQVDSSPHPFAAPTFVPRTPSPVSHPQPDPSREPFAGSARRNRSGTAGWMVAAVCLGLVVALSGIVFVTTQGIGFSNERASEDTAPPTSTTTQTTATTPSPQNATTNTGNGTLPPANADLALSVPLTTVPCAGDYAVFVGAAVNPAQYRSEVQGFLDRFPGSSYLLAEQNCSSLRQRMPNGASIYSVYYGPYSSLADACTARSRVGGDAFIRQLDNSTPVGYEPSC
jgi:serine/threonine-protein kinase